MSDMSITEVILKAIKDFPENSPRDKSVIAKALKDAGYDVSDDKLNEILVNLKIKKIITYDKFVKFPHGLEVPMSGFRMM